MNFASLQAFMPLSSSAEKKGGTVIFQGSDWLSKSNKKLASYYSLADGWKGEGSLAPRQRTVDEAISLIGQIAREIPSLPAPLIGADYDGVITLFWNEPSFLASVSVHGDGTYSYYVEDSTNQNKPKIAKSDSDEIGLPLPFELLFVIAGQPDLPEVA